MAAPASNPYQMLVQPCYPYDSYPNTSEILLLNKLSEGFATSDQNITGVSKDVLQTGTAVLAGAERQSLNVLTAVERNGNDTRMAVERNGNDTRSSIDRVGADVSTRVERNGGDGRMVTVQTAGDVRMAIADSRSLIQNSIGDAKTTLADNIAATLASVERNSAEGRATTYEQSSEGRIQNSQNFAAVRDLVSKEASDIALNSNLNFSNVSKDIQITGTANALAAKDIQIQALQVKSDNLLFAAQNASIARQDTLASTERLAHRISSSEMEAFKNKELLSLQLGRAELEQARSESRILSKMAECCCEIKEKVDERATVTDLLIKDNETSRLKDELLWARLRRRDGWDHHHHDGGRGGSPGRR
jgi:hypothetical protein